MRGILLILFLSFFASACSDAFADRLRRSGSRTRGSPKGVRGYTLNLNSWDNTTGGASDYEGFQAGTNPFVGAETAFSACIWVDGNPGSHPYRTFFGQWGGSDNQWVLQVTNGERMRVTVSNAGTDGSNYEETDASPYTSPGWDQFCFTYAAGTVIIYRNGSVIASSTTGTIPTSLRASSRALFIGTAGSVLNADLGQAVDDIVIFDVALSGAEVAAYYVLLNPDTLGNKIRWWAFDDQLWIDKMIGDRLTEFNGTGDYDLSTSTPY